MSRLQAFRSFGKFHFQSVSPGRSFKTVPSQPIAPCVSGRGVGGTLPGVAAPFVPFREASHHPSWAREIGRRADVRINIRAGVHPDVHPIRGGETDLEWDLLHLLGIYGEMGINWFRDPRVQPA